MTWIVGGPSWGKVGSTEATSPRNAGCMSCPYPRWISTLFPMSSSAESRSTLSALRNTRVKVPAMSRSVSTIRLVTCSVRSAARVTPDSTIEKRGA